MGVVAATVLTIGGTASATEPSVPTPVVEDAAYPGAAKILTEQAVKLVSGDGHILLTDCAATGVNLIQLYRRPDYSRPELSSKVCFSVTGAVGSLTLQIAEVYTIKAEAHTLNAMLNTSGTVQTVQVAPNEWKAVGEGSTGSDSATLLELRVGAGLAAVTGTSPAVGRLDTGGRSCTGTLIAPQWVLTAASCFADDPALPTLAAGAPKRPASIVFPSHGAVAIQILVPRTDRDLVLAKLAAPIADIALSKVAATPPAANATVASVGYGRTATAWVSDAQHTASLTVNSVTATSLAATVSGGLICKGDAGGGATNPAGEIVAVHSRAGQAGCLDAASTSTDTVEARVDNLGDWVFKTLAKRSDVLATYANIDGSTSVLRLPKTGDATHGAPVEQWRSAQYPADKTKSVSGDFNGDGIRDVALLRDSGGGDWRSTLLAGRADGGFDQKPETSHGLISTWGLQLLAGDVNGDGRDDLIGYNNDGNGNFRFLVLPGKADGSGFGPLIFWYTSGDGSWIYDRAKLVAGDFNGDGIADIAAFYDFGGGTTTMFMFRSDKTGFTRSVGWFSGAGNWEQPRGQYTVGDLNGDGTDDIAAMYDYGNAATSVFAWIAQPTGLTMTRWWSVPAGSWEAPRTKLVTGDFTSDRRADLIGLYRYLSVTGVLGLDNTGQGQFGTGYNRIYLAPVYDWTRITPL